MVVEDGKGYFAEFRGSSGFCHWWSIPNPKKHIGMHLEGMDYHICSQRGVFSIKGEDSQFLKVGFSIVSLLVLKEKHKIAIKSFCTICGYCLSDFNYIFSQIYYINLDYLCRVDFLGLYIQTEQGVIKAKFCSILLEIPAFRSPNVFNKSKIRKHEPLECNLTTRPM